MIHAAGKCGISAHVALYDIHAGMINQLIACQMIENGIELQEEAVSRKTSQEIEGKIRTVQAQSKKIRFDF